MKDMKEDNKLNFKITNNSLDVLKNISNTMEGKTFHFHTHLLYDIRTSLGNVTSTYLEIGSYAGGSMSLISSHIYSTNCFTIDLGTPISQDIVERNVLNFKNPNSTFKYFKGNSQDLNLIKLVKTLVKEIDILFIDGDHSRNGVLSDFTNYSNLVKNNGYIIFDDYLDYQFSPEVKGAVDEIVETLDPSNYEIIGSIKYPLLKDFTEMNASSLFIIKKK